MNHVTLHTLLIGLVVSLAPSARAGDVCGSVDADGACVDSKTLVWCDDGELKTQICPQGEVCANHEAFGGAAGCIGTEQTDCGEVTEAGECAGEDRVVVWCEAHMVRAQRCDEGTICHWVDEEGWYDCVPTPRAAGMPPSPTDDNTTDDNGTVDGPQGQPDDPPVPHDGDATDTPRPVVEKGGAQPRPMAGGGGGAGCAGGDASGGLLGLLLLLLLPLDRRRRLV